MSALLWTDQADLAGGDPVIEAYLDAMHQNQEALITSPVSYNFAAVNETGAAYVTKVTQELLVPPGVATLQGLVLLRVRLEAWVDAGDGQLQLRLGGGSWVESGVITVTAPGTTITVDISDADVKAAAGTLAILELQLKRITTGPMRAQYTGGGTRFERQA